jgi:polyhydroxyalkanoate synthesis regulator phasin
MGNKILAALVAGGLLVGAGLLTSVVSSPGTALAQEETDSSDDRSPVPRILGFLGEVLHDLVGEGTITQDQADAIVDATESKATEIKEEREALRDLIQGLLDDDVVTEVEAAQLPEDHWLVSDVFDDAWEDGELTVEEIRELRPHPRREAFKNGLRFGALLDDGGIDQEEYDSLADDHPLRQIDVSEYLEDGLITPDELREIHQELRGADSGDDA